MESNNKEGVFNDRGDMGKTQDPRRCQFMVRRKPSELSAVTTKNYMDFDTDSENENDTKSCFSCSSIKTQMSNKNASTKQNSDYVLRLKPVQAREDVSILNEDKCKPRKKNINDIIIKNEKESASDSEQKKSIISDIIIENKKESDSEISEKTKDLKVEVIRFLENDCNRSTTLEDFKNVYLCANIYVFGAMLCFRVTRKPMSVVGVILIVLLVIFLLNFFPH